MAAPVPKDGELPDYGVVATSSDRLVECDNRLLSRLEGALHGAQPVVRAALFPGDRFAIAPSIERAIERAKPSGGTGHEEGGEGASESKATEGGGGGGSEEADLLGAAHPVDRGARGGGGS